LGFIPYPARSIQNYLGVIQFFNQGILVENDLDLPIRRHPNFIHHIVNPPLNLVWAPNFQNPLEMFSFGFLLPTLYPLSSIPYLVTGISPLCPK
jgi:hypothetical protein